MIQELSDKLKTVFDSYKGASKPFVTVYDYHTLDNVGYPYLSFEPIERTAEILDSCTNMRTYVFQVLIFQEVTEQGGRKEAKEIISACIDDVVGALDRDFTLTGGVTQVVPVSGTISPLLINNGKALVCEMKVNIQTIESITS